MQQIDAGFLVAQGWKLVCRLCTVVNVAHVLITFTDSIDLVEEDFSARFDCLSTF
jgi:hypothetical protein